jgi:hypothetical protein
LTSLDLRLNREEEDHSDSDEEQWGLEKHFVVPPPSVKTTLPNRNFIKFIANVVEKSTTLQTFSLNHYPLGDDGLMTILEALKKNGSSKISHLNLSYCNLSKVGIRALFGYTSNTGCSLRGSLHGNLVSSSEIESMIELYNDEKRTLYRRFSTLISDARPSECIFPSGKNRRSMSASSSSSSFSPSISSSFLFSSSSSSTLSSTTVSTSSMPSSSFSSSVSPPLSLTPTYTPLSNKAMEEGEGNYGSFGSLKRGHKKPLAEPMQLPQKSQKKLSILNH